MFSKKAAFTLSTFAAAAANAANFSVANASDQPINVGIQVPAKTVASISLMPLGQLKLLSKEELQEELLDAVMRDSEESIRALVLAGADINYEYRTRRGRGCAFTFAVISKKKNAQITLLELGANIPKNIHYHEIFLDDKRVWNVLRKASDFKNRMLQMVYCFSQIFKNDPQRFREILKDCIAEGHDINDLWYRFISCQQVDALILREFLELGVDPNIVITRVDNRGNKTYTPLTSMIFINSIDCVKMLIAYGADVNMKANPHGSLLSPLVSPLLYAISGLHDFTNPSKRYADRLSIIGILVDNGAKL